MMLLLQQITIEPLKETALLYISVYHWQIKRVLPAWLASPDVLGTDLTDDAGGLSRISGLDDDLVEKLKQNGIKHFFPGKILHSRYCHHNNFSLSLLKQLTGQKSEPHGKKLVATTVNLHIIVTNPYQIHSSRYFSSTLQ